MSIDFVLQVGGPCNWCCACNVILSMRIELPVVYIVSLIFKLIVYLPNSSNTSALMALSHKLLSWTSRVELARTGWLKSCPAGCIFECHRDCHWGRYGRECGRAHVLFSNRDGHRTFAASLSNFSSQGSKWQGGCDLPWSNGYAPGRWDECPFCHFEMIFDDEWISTFWNCSSLWDQYHEFYFLKQPQKWKEWIICHNQHYFLTRFPRSADHGNTSENNMHIRYKLVLE